MNYDFSGWATKNDLKCADGRTIRQDAFKGNDGATVPLVWNHQHREPDMVLGHAVLENRPEGVYAYGYLNDTDNGKNAKEMIKHGDVRGLSIWANGLKEVGGNVMHGVIREVSLVLAGANPGATIDYIGHSIDDYGEEEADDEAYITVTGDISLYHADEKKEEPEVAENKERTVKDVYDEMTDEQKRVVAFLVGRAMEENDSDEEEKDSDKEEKDMHHNVFEQNENHIEHSISKEEVMAAIKDAKRLGSMKEAFIQHGIEDIDYLFPDARNLDGEPQFISRDMEWVTEVADKAHKTPFARVKSIFANITEDEARAKGFLPDHTHRDAKGNLVDAQGRPAYKKEEVFSLLKRTTDPTTVYKKQKMDRDDLIDITDFDVIAWLKKEMKVMLKEEIARAILIGDGRSAVSEDKINENNIRPIWKDEELFTIHYTISGVTTSTGTSEVAREFIKSALRARPEYKGSGNPTLYTTEDMLTEMLLLEDTTGRRIYNNANDLATAMRVSKIVTVPVMHGQTRTDETGTFVLKGIIVNMNDYNIGSNRGGETTMFDDFDIDYNTMKYLIETRMSGALTKPCSAIALELGESNPD